MFSAVLFWADPEDGISLPQEGGIGRLGAERTSSNQCCRGALHALSGTLWAGLLPAPLLLVGSVPRLRTPGWVSPKESAVPKTHVFLIPFSAAEI